MLITSEALLCSSLAFVPTHEGPGLSIVNPVDGATERVPTLQNAALPRLRTGDLRQQTASHLPEHQDPADCGMAGS